MSSSSCPATKAALYLQLRRVHPVLGVVGRVLVQVGHEDGLAVGGLDVFSRAAVAMTAGTNFLYKRRAMSESGLDANVRVNVSAWCHSSDCGGVASRAQAKGWDGGRGSGLTK